MELLKNIARTSAGLLVSMPVPGIIRITDGSHKGSCMVSARLRCKAPKVDGDRLVWGNIAIEPENGLALYLGNQLLCRDYPGKRVPMANVSQEEIAQLTAEGHSFPWLQNREEDWKVEVCKQLPADAVIYGLGDKTGFLNKRHYAYVNWNTDDPKPHCDNYQSLYKSINFFMVFSQAGCCGILADNTCRTRFDFGKESDEYYFWSHESGGLDYYLIPGKDPKEVLSKYLTLTGSPVLQQKWVYGFHQSRWGYYTDREVLEVADTFRRNQLPLDVIHLDIDYMRGYRVFTFDDQRFARPKELTDSLAEKNVKAVTIIDPGVKAEPGYFMYDEGVRDGHFAKNPDGSIYEGTVWPGTTAFPDFTRKATRDWWAAKIKLLTDAGIRGIWNDMNEPANFTGQLPGDVRFEKGQHDAIHNVYGHYMAMATYDGLLAADGRRPFILTRACCAGSQRFAAGWTGDNHALWAHLQLALTQMMNLGLSGMFTVGSDVGGFGSDTTPELLIRWFQLGAISPFFRDHCAKAARHQEPYVFGTPTMDACRKALDLRYHLLPYIYDLAHENLPILRPLVLEFPEDEHVRELTDQCMIGPSLLAAPVMTPGITARAVYLPRGTWYDYYTGKRCTGGRYILAEAPLDRMPLFARAGAILPVAQGKPQSVEDITAEALEIFPGRGTHIHYTDDGQTLDYTSGGIRCLKIRVSGSTVTQTVTASGYPGADSLPVIRMGSNG